MSNLAITIGRQYGSGGREIGMALAKKLGIKCFDKEILKEASKASGICEEMFEKVDEKPINSFLYSIVTNGFPAYSTPLQLNNMLTDDKIFTMQANTIKTLSEENPAVFVGRCADDILKENDKLVRLFIYSGKANRVKRISEKYKMSEKEASELIRKIDKSRSSYYEFYANKKWGDMASYDLCIDSSLGTDKVVDVIISYMKIKGVL